MAIAYQLGRANIAPRGGAQTKDIVRAGGGVNPPQVQNDRAGGGADPP